MRFLLLRHSNRNAFGENLVSELKQYRLCGVILMLMNIALSGVVILVIRKNEGFQYAGYLIYVMAMYAFYNVITGSEPHLWQVLHLPWLMKHRLSGCAFCWQFLDLLDGSCHGFCIRESGKSRRRICSRWLKQNRKRFMKSVKKGIHCSDWYFSYQKAVKGSKNVWQTFWYIFSENCGRIFL